MPPTGDSLGERVHASYLLLSAVASDLNSVSDELGKSVTELDSALKKLNLGISVWVSMRGNDGLPEDTWYRNEDLGYAKIGGKWGIALRTVSGDYQYPEHENVEEWLFNDAPRSLRLSAIGHVAELLDALSKEADETTKKLKAKLAEAQAVATAVKEAAADLANAENQAGKRPGGQKK